MSTSLPWLFFQSSVVKQLCLRHGKRSVFAFLQFTHYCWAPPLLITRRCRGVTDELFWGSGMLLIDSTRKMDGTFIFWSFFKWKRDLFFCHPLFFRATFWRGLKVCILRCKLLRVDLCDCVLHLACMWIWFRWRGGFDSDGGRNLDLVSKVRPQTCPEWICQPTFLFVSKQKLATATSIMLPIKLFQA